MQSGVVALEMLVVIKVTDLAFKTFSSILFLLVDRLQPIDQELFIFSLLKTRRKKEKVQIHFSV